MDKKEFLKIAKTIKWTKPQQKIVDRLLDGSLIWILNEHRTGGGEWTWKVKGSSDPQYAGTVYRAFWNVVFEVGKTVGDTHLNVNYLFYSE